MASSITTAIASLTGERGGAGKPPSRLRLEHRLRRRGLHCAVRGYGNWERFAVEMVSAPNRVLGAVASTVYVVFWFLWLVAKQGEGFRFFNLLPFDAGAPIVLVSSFVIAKMVYKRKRSGSALAKWLVPGTVLALFLAVVPYVVFTQTRLDTRLAAGVGAAHSVVHARQAGLVTNFVIMGIVGLIVVVDVTTGIPSTGAALLWSSIRAAPRIFVSLLHTLPFVLTVLFFFAFTRDTWTTFGDIGLNQLVVLILLLFACVVVVVVRASNEEVRELLAHTSVPFGDGDIARLRALGVDARRIDVDRRVLRALRLQWIFHITLRVVLAAVLVAVVIWIATGLALTQKELTDWLGQKPRGFGGTIPILKVHFFLTAEGLSVAAVLGAFASLVFAGQAIAERNRRVDLFEPERRDLAAALWLAGTYQNAVRDRLWRGKPGQTWRNYSAFLAEDPDRWRVEPDDLGTRWSDAARPGGRERTFKAAWNPETGELYIFRYKASEVRLLAVCTDRDRFYSAIDGWERNQVLDDSVSWLREAAALAAA